MRFQKTTEYAIRVMVYLAKHKTERFSAKTLHKELNIPYKYLSRLMSILSAAELVDVRPGKHGGYKMKHQLSEIYLYQIADLVEGLEDYERCVLGFPNCSDERPCSIHQQWMEHREGIKNMLYNTSLADLDYSDKIQL